MKIYQNNDVYDTIILEKILGRTDEQVGCLLSEKLGRPVSRERVCRIRQGAKYQHRVTEVHAVLVSILNL